MPRNGQGDGLSCSLLTKEIFPEMTTCPVSVTVAFPKDSINPVLAWKTISKFTTHSVITKKDILEICTYFASTYETLPEIFNYPRLAIEAMSRHNICPILTREADYECSVCSVLEVIPSPLTLSMEAVLTSLILAIIFAHGIFVSCSPVLPGLPWSPILTSVVQADNHQSANTRVFRPSTYMQDLSQSTDSPDDTGSADTSDGYPKDPCSTSVP